MLMSMSMSVNWQWTKNLNKCEFLRTIHTNLRHIADFGLTDGGDMLQYPQGELEEDTPQLTGGAWPDGLRLLLLGLEFTGPGVGALVRLRPNHREHLRQQGHKVLGLAVLHALVEWEELKLALGTGLKRYDKNKLWVEAMNSYLFTRYSCHIFGVRDGWWGLGLGEGRIQ